MDLIRRTLAALLLALLVAIPTSLADDGEDGKDAKDDKDDDHDDDRGDGSERKMELDVDSDKATIKLEREEPGREDSVKVEYDVRGAKLQVKHEEKSEEAKEEQKLEARFLAVLEFVDADGDGAYDPGEPVPSAWRLSSSEGDFGLPMNGTVRWGAISVTDVSSGNGSADGKRLSSRAQFGPNGTFGLDLYVFGDFALVGNASLEPTEVKIDILVDSYPYVRSDSAVAVLLDLKAKSEFKDRDEDGEDGLAAEGASTNATFLLKFTWLDTAEVDGAERDVQSTVVKSKSESSDGKEERKARIAFAYGRGEHILHDPTVGVQYASAEDADAGAPAPAVFAVAATLVVAAAVRRRR